MPDQNGPFTQNTEPIAQNNPYNTNVIQEQYSQQVAQKPTNSSSYSVQPPYPTPNFDPPSNLPPMHDPLGAGFSKISQNPGKSLYFGLLCLSLIFTFLPWFNQFDNYPNYYWIVGNNFLSLIYLFSLIDLIAIRFILWNHIVALKPYTHLLEYLEVLEVGAIVMFVITVGAFSSISFGTILSVISNLLILAYLSYLKIIKEKQ